jgi:hypothetical protein
MKVVNVSNGDYKLIVRDSGNITFDVGNDGLVLITGDLQVAGDVTTIQSETLTVKDNIIYLNVGGGSATGITPALTQKAGIEIDRGGAGQYSNIQILVDDTVSHLTSNGGSAVGTVTFTRQSPAGVGANNLVGIQTCSINTNGENLYLINAPGGGVVSVTGTSNYERSVFNYTNYDLIPPTGPISIVDPDALPNVQALADYVNSNLTFFDDYLIKESNTSVECIDKDAANPYRLLLNPLYTLPATSKISFSVDGSERGQFNVNGLNVDNVRVLTNTVSNTDAGSDLILTATNNNIQLGGYLKFVDQTIDPSAISGFNRVYSKAPGTGVGTPGKTGMYFVNTLTSDELVAKNRALLFSILF